VPDPVTCGTCRYFDNQPETFERTFPGLVSFGSGHASVRDDDGLCRLHDRYLSIRSSCRQHASVVTSPPRDL
jgi:hypothetical protein